MFHLFQPLLLFFSQKSRKTNLPSNDAVTSTYIHPLKRKSRIPFPLEKESGLTFFTILMMDCPYLSLFSFRSFFSHYQMMKIAKNPFF